MVVLVPETGYNSDSEKYKSGYAHFKSFLLKTLALITGFLGIGWNFYHIFSSIVIIAIVLILVAVLFIRIRE